MAKRDSPTSRASKRNVAPVKKPFPVGFAVGCVVLASLLIGVLQTFAVAIDYSLVDAIRAAGISLSAGAASQTLLKLTISQVAPILPYLFLVLILIFRPKGLLGTRDD